MFFCDIFHSKGNPDKLCLYKKKSLNPNRGRTKERGMKEPKKRTKLAGIFLLLFFNLTLQSATLRVKVIVDNASVKAKAEIFGDVLAVVSSGTVLDAEEKQGEWYKVRLEKEGSLISGFIHELFVEEMEIEEVPEKKVEIPAEKPELPVKKPVLAVVNLTPQNVSFEDANIITGFIQEELFFAGQHELIERTQVEEVLKEYQNKQTGICDLNCAINVGKQLKANQIIMGTVGKLGEYFTVQIKTVDIESDKISNMSSIRAKCQLGELPNYIGELVGKITSAQIKAESPAQELPKEEVQRPVEPSRQTRPETEKPETRIQDTSVSEGSLVPLQSVDVDPVVVKSVAPRHDWEKALIVQEKVVVNMLISEKGDVENAVIIGGTKMAKNIRQAVLRAVRQWKFKPATKDGKKVKVWKPFVVRITRDLR